MKFSVLLPTRNRLHYLKYAISSVLRQNYANWELIISDNASEEPIDAYVTSLCDSRIRYLRQTQFVSVTENWNHALESASGDYVIMLGDDDRLMQDFFTTVLRQLETFKLPDMIYTSGFLYYYPDVVPNCPRGCLDVFGNASFLEKKKEAFFLPKKLALSLVQDSLNFRVQFAYNMQHAILSKRLIDSLSSKGPFFQSPYPDYYAMTASMLAASSILALPEPIVTVGVSPKSFGFYYFNNKEKEGTSFLNASISQTMPEALIPYILPGSDMNTCWLLAMEAIKNNFSKELSHPVNYSRYRFLQIIQSGKQSLVNNDLRELTSLWKKLTLKEKVFFYLPLLIFVCLVKNMPSFFRRAGIYFLSKCPRSHPHFIKKHIPGDFMNIMEVFENIHPSCSI